MKGIFSFHPVGHGLFYTGNIKHSSTNDEVNFIYDIGSMSHVQIATAVKKFCDKTKKVDFVFLSHLDKDHISGLYDLLKHKTQIDTIIMPYYSWNHIKFIKYENLKDFEKNIYIYKDYPYDTLEFLLDFYCNPYSCLGQYNIKILIYSTLDISKIDIPIDTDFRHSEPLHNTDDVILKSLLESEYQVKYTRKRNVFLVHPDNTKKTTITYKDWVFDIKQPGFNLKHKIEIEKITSDLNDTFSNYHDEEKRNNTTKKAKKYIKNNDCITLKHYPYGSKHRKEHTLLTGDFCGESMYTNTSGLLANGMEYYVVQIPHHGSEIQPNITIDAKTEYSVACYSSEDKKHPNASTIKAYEKISSKPIVHVTEQGETIFNYEYDNQRQPPMNGL